MEHNIIHSDSFVADIVAHLQGGNLQWTSIPSGGSKNTPGHFILQKPNISDGLMGLLARPILIGAGSDSFQNNS